MRCSVLLRFLATAAAVLLLAHCAADPQYSLRGDAATGSHIGRQMASSSCVPINKRYDELSDADKECVRKDVRQWEKNVGPGDDVPFPAAGLQPLLVSIKSIADRWLWSGSVTELATVSANGDVTEVVIYGASPIDFGRETSAVLRRTKFTPARCAGQPCVMRFPLHIQFEVIRDDSVHGFKPVSDR